MTSYVSGHVALNVYPSETSQNEFKKSKSVWRVWKQLSRLQRSLIYLFVIIFLSLISYFIFTDLNSNVILDVKEKSNLNSVQDSWNKIKNRPTQDINEKPIIQPKLKVDEDIDHTTALLAPKIEGTFSGPTTNQQREVVKAFSHAWKGYKKFAWGHDNLKPISEGYNDWFGLGLSIVDAIDTIYIMGLTEEYQEAREWIDKQLHFDINRDVNLFEVTIRVLGGLLSIYHLTEDPLYLNKAIDLGDRLLPCFESDSGVPYSDVNLFTRKAHAPKWSPDSSTSEVTTIQLEFRDLSRSSGNPKYEEAAAKISSHIHTLEKKDGLVPIFINANSGQFRSYATITLGARGDSYYEYLLKQWIQTGKTIDYLKEDYIEGINGVKKHLARRTVPHGFQFLGELLAGGKDFKPKMDHLTCYLPGTLALGHKLGMPEDHLTLANDLLKTCYETYAQQPTFLAPEITYFNTQEDSTSDMYVKTNDAHNLLRPEFIESLWYMYQLTKNTTYQEMGWKIFQAIEKYTKVTNGYTSIGNVRNIANLRYKDMMESFFLSETLKYLYLLFSGNPKLLDLEKIVMNSEAHPLPIYNS